MTERPVPFAPKEALSYIPERYQNDRLLYDEFAEPLNISARSEDRDLRMLSNFHESPFTLDGVEYQSVEGFIQSLKFWQEEDQERVAGKAGFAAKKGGHKVREYIKEGFRAEEGEEPVGYVTNYQGIAIPFRSPEHYDLIARAIRAKFDRDYDCRKALLKTKRSRLTHDLGHPESPTTSLPAEVFTTILMQIRQEYQLEELNKLAQQGDVTHHLNRFYQGTDVFQNPHFLKVQKLGYKNTAVGWLRSLTPEGMKYGAATEDERIEKARHFAQLAGTKDLSGLAREAGLVKEEK